MHRRRCVWFGLLLSSAVLILIGCRGAQRSTEAVSGQANQRNAIVHAAGTIVSVEERAHDEQSYDLLPGPRVCFTIDSFAEVPGADRNVYESTEHARQAAQGPRCRDTSIDPSAVHVKVGDRVDVYFNSENSGQISIIRVSMHGVDL